MKKRVVFIFNFNILEFFFTKTQAVELYKIAIEKGCDKAYSSLAALQFDLSN